MPNFVWTAKNVCGDPVVRQIKAATIEESKAVLLSEGCTDLVLKEDDVIAATLEGFDERVSLFGEDILPSAEALIKARERLSRVGVFSFIRRNGLFLLAILAICLAFVFQNPKAATSTTLIILICAALFLWLKLPLIYFNRINKAKDWHRWPQVLRLVERSEFIRRFHFIKLPRNRAECRAGGRFGCGVDGDDRAFYQGEVGSGRSRDRV